MNDDLSDLVLAELWDDATRPWELLQTLSRPKDSGGE